MKLLALGGSGDMGQVAVRTILDSAGMDQLIVADRDIDRAKAFVDSLVDNRASARQLDVEDTSALEVLISEADMVMNTVGPFYRFAIPVIRAAIRTGRNYVDIMDDPGPAVEALELDEEARRAGVTVLIGMGASPGITNILARHAVNHLDEVDYIQTVWGSVGGMRRPRSAIRGDEASSEQRVPAAIIHFLFCAAWEIPVFRDGKFVNIIPLENGEEVTFPNGRGFFRYYGHGESVTLPHFIRGLKGACNLTGQGPEEFDILREFGAKIRAGELTAEKAAEMYVPELYRRRKQRPDETVDMGPRVGGLHASASGRKDGKPVRYGYGCTGAPLGGMGGVTGIPLAIGIEMIMNGEISQKGVLAPEACIDPLPFFERYMKYWTNQPQSVVQALYEVVEEL